MNLEILLATPLPPALVARGSAFVALLRVSAAGPGRRRRRSTGSLAVSTDPVAAGAGATGQRGAAQQSGPRGPRGRRALPTPPRPPEVRPGAGASPWPCPPRAAPSPCRRSRPASASPQASAVPPGPGRLRRRRAARPPTSPATTPATSRARTPVRTTATTGRRRGRRRPRERRLTRSWRSISHGSVDRDLDAHRSRRGRGSSSPPADSAVRRTISRPSPVAAGAVARALARQPRPVVGDEQAAGVAGADERDPERRPVRGVGEDVVDQDVDEVAQVVGVDRDRQRAGRPARRQRRGPGPRRAPTRRPTRSRTDRARRRSGRSGRARTGRRASFTIASIVRCRYADVLLEPVGELGVGRPPRRRAAARSPACAAGARGRRPRPARPPAAPSIRSASRFSARAELPGLRGAGRLGARVEVALAQSVGDAGQVVTGVLTRRPSRPAIATAATSSSTAEPDDRRPGARAPRGAARRPATVVRTTSVPSAVTTGTRISRPGVVHPGERLAAGGRARPRGPRPSPWPGAEHVGRRRSARWSRPAALVDGVDQPAQRGGSSCSAGDQDRDVARLLVGGGHRPVLGQGAHQQAQRDHEREDDR